MPLNLFLMFIILQVLKLQAFNIQWDEVDQTDSHLKSEVIFCIFALDGLHYWDDPKIEMLHLSL